MVFPVGFVPVFIGIGILRFWYQYNLYNLHFVTDYGLGVAWANILRALVGWALVLCAIKQEIPQRWRNVLVWGSLVLMTASSAFNFLELVIGSTSFEVARYVTLGVGLVWGGGMWMDFFARLRPSTAFFYLVSGLALSCFLSLVCGYLSPYAMGLLNLFVPACSVLSYLYAMRVLDVRGVQSGPLPQRDVSFSVSYRSEVVSIGCAFFLFAFVMGIGLGFPNGHPRPLSQLGRTIHQAALIVVLTCVLLWVFAAGRRFRFAPIWSFENCLIIACIMLLVDESSTTNEVGTALILSAESFFYSFVFYTSYTVGLRTRHPGIFILGVYYSASLFGMGLGRLFSAVTLSLPGSSATLVLLMAILLVVELVLALCQSILRGNDPLFSGVSREALQAENAVYQQAILDAQAKKNRQATAAHYPQIPTENQRLQSAQHMQVAQRIRTADREGAASGRVSAEPRAVGNEPDRGYAYPGGADWLSGELTGTSALGPSMSGAFSEIPELALRLQNLAELSERCGLTEVETRIADLIAHGRSRAIIANELGYSENTVRNYTRTLYQKLGIHSKQELIDLLEGFKPEHADDGRGRNSDS